MITVVSKPLKDELIGRGVPAEKILVNPNGVDPQRYRPDIDGGRVRRQYGLEGKTIVGFIGTFGSWHGAEVLAEAAVKLIKELKIPADAHFLFIGDGVRLPETKRIIRKGGIEERVTFTGLVPQEQGAEYLAACDILVAPHVPNPDGSPFFGSPTKLFEYMAMGRGIVASNLDQIGEVLEHGKTAWLVPPGNVEGLAAGILVLVSDKELRDRLGRNARTEVLQNYIWKQHVARTMDKLAEVLK
jgi:glycosyltransferase involved in cell wall biosynthesis